MKRLLFILSLLIGAAAACHAQSGNTVTITASGAPTGACSYIFQYIDSATGNQYNCKAGAWNQIGSGSSSGPTITSGTYASLPATCTHTSTSSDLYYATDSQYTFVCSATNTWSAYWQGRPVTVPPACGSMTILGNGQTAASCSSTTGMFVLSATGPSACCNNYAAVKTAPATPYTITTSFVWSGAGGPTTVNSGIIFRNSSSGKAVAFEYYNQTFRVEYWISMPATGASTDGSTLTSVGIPTIQVSNVYHLRMTDNGTNRIYYYSVDALNWIQLYSEARTTNFTADQIGFVTLGFSGTNNDSTATFYEFTVQ